MGLFDKLLKNIANDILNPDDYECKECDTKMNLEGDVLVCPNCGHSVDLEDYYTEYDEDESDYNTYWNEDSDEEEDSSETYEEVWGEMSRKLSDD